MWRDAWTGAQMEGGTTLEADAPLERIPVFLREGSSLELRAGTVGRGEAQG